MDAAESLWLPREDQLRELLGPAFVSLSAGFTVVATIDGADRSFTSDDAAEAYGLALQAYITAALA